MAKTVLLIRHAKSSWDDANQKDIDRPLNRRGREDAPKMAERLQRKGVKIGQFLCSPARRTRETVEYFLQTLGAGKERLKIVDGLYEPEIIDFEKAIAGADEQAETIAIIAHNPGITYYASMVTNIRIDNMPTSGIFAYTANAKNWAEFLQMNKEFLFFEYPKLLDK